jgi:hypothetical protein
MKLTVFALVGALIGVTIASLVVPPILSWYAAPGGLPKGTQIQAVVEIPTVILYATGRLISAQLIAGCLGAVFGLITGFRGSRQRSQTAARVTT